MKKLFLLFTVIVWMLSLPIMAQTDTIGKQKYTPEYRFADGIYLSFSQVLINKPVSFDRIMSDSKNGRSVDELLKLKTISYYDEFGSLTKITTESLWGYCQNGILYIYWDNDFYRIPYLGKISHYVASQTVRTGYSPDPFMGYYGMEQSYETTKLVQNILDFETGRSYPLSVETVHSFILRDKELNEEFSQLTKRKKRQLLFLYIRRYNERNPLWLPKNENE
jgi:hypothetical protein